MSKISILLYGFVFFACALKAQDTMYVYNDGNITAKISLKYTDSITYKLNDDTYVTDYDGNYYVTVTIGDQVWMAENLNTTHYNDGATIPFGTYTWYNLDENSYSRFYGALYKGLTISTNKLCPSGWHVPTNEEWTTLIDFAGGSDSAAIKLKQASTLYWYPEADATQADNEYGFTALPGGYRQADGDFDYANTGGIWWSSTPGATNTLLVHGLYFDRDDVGYGEADTERSHSVRCIKD